MRFSDTFGRWKAIEGKYKPALDLLFKATGIPTWLQITDSHQVSTRDAGKSACAFFVHTFTSLKDAADALTVIHRELPSVNAELHLTPDGFFDRGDGPGSYTMRAKWETDSQYIPQKGMSCTLLVDVQNIMRIVYGVIK